MIKTNGQEGHPLVLAVGLGRGSSGKSTGLSELIWRARSQGRSVIVADGDARSETLTGMFPDAIKPPTEELADTKNWLSGVLNQMAKEKKSAVLDLGGGDRLLLEYGRDLRLVQFCERRGIEPLALYFLGPEDEDFSHVWSIWQAAYFKPRRCLLVLNEGVIREGKTVAGAFARTMAHPGFEQMVAEGARPILMHRLACMDLIKASRKGFYSAASGDAGLDPVEEFMTEDWLIDLEEKRRKAGADGWLP